MDMTAPRIKGTNPNEIHPWSSTDSKSATSVDLSKKPEYTVKPKYTISKIGIWLEPKISYENHRHALIPVSIPSDCPLIITTADGKHVGASGEMVYIKAGNQSKILIGGAGGQSVTHAYYDPTEKVFYCATEKGYKKVKEQDILLTESGGSKITFNWAAIQAYGKQANTFLVDLKQNYFDWLAVGAFEVGLEFPGAQFPNETKIMEALDQVIIVFTRDIVGGAAATANFPNTLLFMPPENATSEIDTGLITHEFTHLFLHHAEQISSGKHFSPFGPGLVEGETDFFAAMVGKGMGEEFATGTYGSMAYIIGVYAFLLGPDKFFKVCLTPGQVDLHSKMDRLLGEPGKHARMMAYFNLGRTKYVISDGMAFEALILRVLGELELYGVDWKKTIDKVEPLFQYPKNITFYERFGMVPNKPLLEQAQHGTQYFYFSSPIEPFDVREALKTAPEKLKLILSAITILNTLDYSSYNPQTQQLALGVWRKVVENFIDYWNGLTPEERSSSENQKDLWWFTQTSFALATRFGITPTNIFMDLSNAMGSDEPIKINANAYGDYDPSSGVNYPTKTMHIVTVNAPQIIGTPLDKAIEQGNVFLFLEQMPWKFERTVSTGLKHWKLSLASEGAVVINIVGWHAIVTGLAINVDGPIR